MVRHLFLLLSLLSPEKAACPTVGGQAVMEGVMMRKGPQYAVAVRQPDGRILVESFPWFTLARGFFRKPFLRGFPVLVETMVNGIRALNISAGYAPESEKQAAGNLHLVLTLCVSLVMAAVLFVLVPHLLSLGMQYAGLGGGVEGMSFHLWDGFYKCAVFISYIWAISFVPDIRRVLQFHGAEHKAIHAFERGGEVSPASASRMSRLHPRCGTTFILFVISISIVVHALLLPVLLYFWTPENVFLKHGILLLFKLGLIVPVSALAYELIHFAGRMPDGPAAAVLRAPGLVLQYLTTREPEREHLEVALVALREALDDPGAEVLTPTYSRVE